MLIVRVKPIWNSVRPFSEGTEGFAENELLERSRKPTPAEADVSPRTQGLPAKPRHEGKQLKLRRSRKYHAGSKESLMPGSRLSFSA
jgi:hypothetical protein